MLKYTPKQIIRFWSKVAKTDNLNECWEWQASCSRFGYGRFSHHYISCRSHRVAWELTYGEIPEGFLVCHSCDNPRCCNPNHLFLGTHKDNMQDMAKKGRQKLLMGELNGNHKLTDEQISNIRDRYAQGGISHRKLAKEIGISSSYMSYILSGRRR